MRPGIFVPREAPAFWFPDTGHQRSLQSRASLWTKRMRCGRGGAIIDRFADLTLAAATGQLDHWAGTPRGRLALFIALDQFPRLL